MVWTVARRVRGRPAATSRPLMAGDDECGAIFRIAKVVAAGGDGAEGDVESVVWDNEGHDMGICEPAKIDTTARFLRGR